MEAELSEVKRKITAIEFVFGIGGHQNELVDNFRTWSGADEAGLRGYLKELQGYLKELQGYLKELQAKENNLQIEKNLLLQQQLIAAPHPYTTGVAGGALMDIVYELKDELHSVALRQHIMNEKLPKITEVFITPSEYKKSKHKETFLDVMEMFGFGRNHMAAKVIEFAGTLPLMSDELNYTYYWVKGQSESDSYEPLQIHLRSHGIDTVIIGEGQGLPDGLLYHEELWTLKKNVSLRSEDLRKIGEESIFKYILQGRTDLVRKADSGDSLGKSNNRYFIEIKRVEDFVEEDSLREAVLQLIGGNASNSFHSPPVLLTNLARTHYVLFISRVGDPTVKLRFKLNVIKMPTFGVAVAFLEERTTVMNSVTLHLGRKPTPPSSPPKAKNASDDADDDIAERFGNVNLEEAVTDEYGDVV